MPISVSKLIEKMYDKYSYCLDKKDCKDLAEDIMNIVDNSDDEREPIISDNTNSFFWLLFLKELFIE